MGFLRAVDHGFLWAVDYCSPLGCRLFLSCGLGIAGCGMSLSSRL